MVEKGRGDHVSGRLVPGICRRLFNFFMSFLAYYLRKPVILGATNYSELPASVAAGPFSDRRNGSILLTEEKGLINVEIEQETPKTSDFSGHAHRKITGQGSARQGLSTSPNMEEGNVGVDIIIERGKWKVEGDQTSSTSLMMVEQEKKRESRRYKEKKPKRAKQEERKGIMRKRSDTKEVLDIDERSEHFIRQRKAVMRAGSDVEPI